MLNGNDREQVQLASDNNQNGNPDPFPQIPEQKPTDSKEATSVLRNIANWVGRNAGKVVGAADVIDGLAEQIDWIAEDVEAIKSYRDPPKTLEEMQAPIGSKSQKGYEDHHIVKQSSVNDGISQQQIDRPDNQARIPVLRHQEITAYYNKGVVDLPDGTKGSVKEYLRDKTFEERREFGLQVMRDKGVLK